jgi:hypothetical protein
VWTQVFSLANTGSSVSSGACRRPDVSPSPTPGKGLFLGWTGSVLVYANGDEDRLLLGANGPSKARS